ncbi:MAG: hypothetical protein R8G66_06120 [Cytophagales bacterium]|nr:hypothetical protein [Cytophagales bacterium]
MIAGELENIMGLESEYEVYAYDEFLGSGKGKKSSKRQSNHKPGRKAGLTPEEIARRKQRNKNFWSGLNNTLKDNGGIEGVTGSIGNLFSVFKKNPTASNSAPRDFQFGLAGPTPPTDNGRSMIGIYVVGGAVVVGLAVYGFTYFQKGKGKTKQLINEPNLVK